MNNKANAASADLQSDVPDRSAGVPPAVAGAPGSRWAEIIATFFGIGRLRPGPGTWGSAGNVLLWLLIARWVSADLQALGLAPLTSLACRNGISCVNPVLRAWGLRA